MNRPIPKKKKQHIVRLCHHPDFPESLRMLIRDEKHSLTDVGMMFGVSRERVRQWCAQHEIETFTGVHKGGKFDIRLWDDVAHRFVAVDRKTFRIRRKRQHALKRSTNRQSELRSRRAHMIRLIRKEYNRQGRWITLAEIFYAVGGSRDTALNHIPSLLGNMWGRSKHISYKQIFTTIRTRAGMLPTNNNEYSLHA